MNSRSFMPVANTELGKPTESTSARNLTCLFQDIVMAVSSTPAGGWKARARSIFFGVMSSFELCRDQEVKLQ